MLLEPLVSVLAEVKERLERHDQELRQSEALTRSALIDPVLRALGWNPEDPALVRPEYQVSDGKADYALFSVASKAVAIVEVKSLGRSLEQDRELDQLLRYSFFGGIPYGVLTNGDNWHVYDLKMPGGVAMRERRTLETTIADAEPYQCALQLLYLWRPNLASGQPVTANVPPAPVAAPIAPPAPAQPQPAPARPIYPTDAALPGNWTPLSRVHRASGDAKPRAIRFPNGESRQVRDWVTALVQLADWLAENEHLIARDCPIPGLAFINSRPINARGIEFRRPERVAGGIYVNVHGRASALASYMRKLLDHTRTNYPHINPETVELLFEQ